MKFSLNFSIFVSVVYFCTLFNFNSAEEAIIPYLSCAKRGGILIKDDMYCIIYHGRAKGGRVACKRCSDDGGILIPNKHVQTLTKNQLQELGVYRHRDHIWTQDMSCGSNHACSSVQMHDGNNHLKPIVDTNCKNRAANVLCKYAVGPPPPPCTKPTDCSMGEYCISGFCGGPCQSDSDCEAGDYCLSSGSCGECRGYDDCTSPDVCRDNNTCGACTHTNQCINRLSCDITNGLCGECRGDSFCETGDHCLYSGLCGECRGNGDCTSPDVCRDDDTCGPCLNDDQCNGLSCNIANGMCG